MKVQIVMLGNLLVDCCVGLDCDRPEININLSIILLLTIVPDNLFKFLLCTSYCAPFTHLFPPVNWTVSSSVFSFIFLKSSKNFHIFEL